jgi:hypothetical protein
MLWRSRVGRWARFGVAEPGEQPFESVSVAVNVADEVVHGRPRIGLGRGERSLQA